MGSLRGAPLLLAGAAVAAACASPAPRVPAGRAPAIVGVWHVAKFCDDDSTGRLYEPYGPAPVGYFVYAPSGQLAIQIMRTPAVRPFAGGDERPTDAERRGLFDAYMGYFGTYTVTSDSTVVHRVEGGTLPSYIGTDQARVYRVRGDTLTIGGSPATWPCRVLVRVGVGSPLPNESLQLMNARGAPAASTPPAPRVHS